MIAPIVLRGAILGEEIPLHLHHLHPAGRATFTVLLAVFLSSLRTRFKTTVATIVRHRIDDQRHRRGLPPRIWTTESPDQPPANPAAD